jgi:membrane fusion protein, copper/silver efflux system
MTKKTVFSLLLILGIGVGAGYWLAREQKATESHPAAVERKPLYYRHPMNPKATSPTPKKDEMGMDYLPVYAEEPSAATAPSKGRILYYRHPMGAADTSPTPKKDEMGMDYLPVYEGEQASFRQLNISPEKIQKLGVKSEKAVYRQLVHNVRALGGIQPDERRLYVIAPKFEGWVQHLFVNTTGQAVKRGQPLLDIYSPDLITAQQEYIIAKEGEQALQQASPQAQATAQQLMRNALQRLHYWDIGQGQLQRLQKQDKGIDYLPLLSPVAGVVMEKPAVEGMRFMPGEVLFKVADLSKVWLLADIFELDMPWIRMGQTVSVNTEAFPDKPFSGLISFIYPTLNTGTRTVKVRVELDNAQGILRPGLYGSVELIAVSQQPKQLTIPDSAVIDSGIRQVVLVRLGEGLFEPRTVKIGRQAGGYFEVLEGLTEGENVVTRANFLIDAESNLQSALDGMTEAAAPQPPAQPAPSENPAMPEPAHHQHATGN